MKKHIFLILAHKDIVLLKNLIAILRLYNGSILVHYDAKSNINWKELFKEELQDGHLHFIENPKKIFWGSFSIIQATFLLIDQALKVCPDGEYFHLLSEQCYPVKSPAYFDEYFKKNAGTNFIKAFELPDPKWKPNGGLNRVHFYHLNYFFDVRSKSLKNVFMKVFNYSLQKVQALIKFKRKKPVEFSRIYGGSEWWSFTREFLLHANDVYNKNIRIRNFFKYCLIPDELFFQTLFMQSEFSATHKDYNLRYIDWRKNLPGPCPRLLNLNDHWEMIQHPDILFARKINPADKSFSEKVRTDTIERSYMPASYKT